MARTSAGAGVFGAGLEEPAAQVEAGGLVAGKLEEALEEGPGLVGGPKLGDFLGRRVMAAGTENGRCWVSGWAKRRSSSWVQSSGGPVWGGGCSYGRFDPAEAGGGGGNDEAGEGVGELLVAGGGIGLALAQGLHLRRGEDDVVEAGVGDVAEEGPGGVGAAADAHAAAAGGAGLIDRARADKTTVQVELEVVLVVGGGGVMPHSDAEGGVAGVQEATPARPPPTLT